MLVKKYLILLAVLALLVSAAVFAVYADEPQADSEEIWCPQCSKYVPENEWIPWTFTGGTLNAEGHYYLAETFTAQTSEIFIPELKFDCLDLRGNAWITEGIRPLKLAGNLVIIDSVGGGSILTTGADQTEGGFALVSGEKAQFELYGGTIQRIVRDDITLYQGGLFYIDGGTVNLRGGTVSGGVVEGVLYEGTTKLDARGGNIYMKGGSLTVSGGTLAYGMALVGDGSTAQGGNVYARESALIMISDGAVKGGYSDVDGGNIYLGNAALTLSDTGAITAGHAIRNGGNISVTDASAVVSLTGGSVTGGVAGGTVLADSQGYGGGGNLYGYKGTLNIADTTIDGNMRLDATMTAVNLSGVVKIGLGTVAGMIFPSSLTLNVSDLEQGSEIFVRTTGAVTGQIPAEKLEMISGCFKGAVRTELTVDTEANTITAVQGTTGYCPHCYDPANPQTVTWTAGIGSGESATNLHYYLDSALTGGTSQVNYYNDVVLDLNGFPFKRTGNRCVLQTEGITFTLMDSYGGGSMVGTGTNATNNKWGGVIQHNAANTKTVLLSGNMILDPGTETSQVLSGGVIDAITSGASVTVKGGTITGGALKTIEGETGGGGNIRAVGNVTVSAGIIRNGNAGTTYHGGNIYANGKVTVSGGVILDGSANYGGNIYSAKEVAVTGGIIWNGTGKSSGNIYTKKATVTGGVIAFGNATTGGGGNLRMGDSTSEISGDAVIHSGRATTYGGNLYCIQTMTLNIKGGLIVGGSAEQGGNIRTNNTDCVVNITDGLIALGQATDKGGNVYINNGKLIMTSGVITAGTATAGGNIYLNNNIYAAFQDDGDDETRLPVISYGTATTGNGGNIYYYGKSSTDEPAFDYKLQLGNCLITDGSAQYGNNLYIYKLAVLEVLPAFDQETSIYFNSELIPDGTVLNTEHVSCDGVYTGKLLFENDPTLPEIITIEGNPAMVVAKAALVMQDGSVKWFSDNASAIAAYNAQTLYILPDAAEFILPSNDSIENTYVVDLAGKELTISGDDSIKVYCVDSANLDLATNGKVTVNGPKLQNTLDHAVDGVTYITVAEQEADTYTFHCLNMRVASVSIRPSSAGVYYSCIWECDDVAKGMIRNFGVAVSVKDMPQADFEKDSDTRYTRMDVSKLVIGEAFNSVLIDGILEAGDPENSDRGKADIYATPYVTLKSGQKIVCREEFMQSLKSVLELFDTKAYYANKLALEAFYSDWEDVFKQWGFTNIGVKPGDDDVLRVLMIGNSFCYYYVEELYDMLMMNRPAGVDEVEVYNLYYSGRSLSTHLKKWQDGVGDYQLFRTDKNGRQNLAPFSKWSLEMALAQTNWDYISIQGRVSVTGDDTEYDKVEEKDLEAYAKNIGDYAKPLLDHFHKMFPHAQLLWHRTWATENKIRDTINGKEYADGIKYNYLKYDKNMQAVCEYMCNDFDTDKDYDLKMVNSGAAWTEARSLNAAKAESLFPNNGGLSARLGDKKYDGTVENSGDGQHEGDIGGGQLLNAYIWYMTITGDADLSEVIDYRPVYKSGSTEYHLSEELVAMLQQAAITTYASMAAQ